MDAPRIIILAGPNGAGKTSFAREFLPKEGACLNFVNADLIAAGLAPFTPDAAALQAGRLMLQAIAGHVERRESFAFETTLSGRAWARQIPGWRRAGFRVEILFLALPDADAAVLRVASRVAQGGHGVPEAVVRRRFEQGRSRFEQTYKALVDDWVLYDSSKTPPQIVDRRPPPMKPELPASEPETVYAGLPADASPLVRASYPAMLRAAERAREIARQTGTWLVIVRDGRVVRVDPDRLEELPPP